MKKDYNKNDTLSIIIPSAKVVSADMQRLGKLPAALYPIESRTVLGHLYEQYKEYTKNINVVVYEEAHKFDEYLKQKKIVDVNLIKLSQMGDLGETIKAGIENGQSFNGTERVIINFGDTLVFNDFEELPMDGFYYSEDEISSMWTFYEEDNTGIKNIVDKKNIDDKSYDKHKLFVGIFSFSDKSYFVECLNNAQNSDNSMDSFYEAILLYEKKYSLEGIKTDKWCDVGHPERYYNSQLGVRAREFNHITIDKERGILRKTSEDKDKFIGEILWYIKLPNDIEYVRPRIFDYSVNYNTPYVSMEYYSYHTLHELYLYSDITKLQWNKIFNRIKFICKDFSKYTVASDKIKGALKSMYLDKTINRLEKLRENKLFSIFFKNDFTVNGIKYKSIDKIIDGLKEVIPKMLLDVEKFTIIHGDMCFTNIMVDSNFNFVKLIDPRGKFGEFDIYGDQRYELAKLFHSLDGKYEYIIEDQFDVEVVGNNIKYEISERKRDFDIFKEFENEFFDYIQNDLKKIELIESLLFLSMIPLHNESLNQQYVMLGTGVEILARVIDIYEC